MINWCTAWVVQALVNVCRLIKHESMEALVAHFQLVIGQRLPYKMDGLQAGVTDNVPLHVITFLGENTSSGPPV